MTLRVRPVLVCLALVLVPACSSTLVRNPVPAELVFEAQVAGMPEVRSFADQPNPLLQKSLIASAAQETPGDYPPGADGTITYPLLAVSGGGANGAYGAGLLKGWTARGTRPRFKIVTGVSTGALIAPFAFLGPEYDDPLEKCYTATATKDVMSDKGAFQLLGGNSLADNAPLASLIARYFDPAVIAAVAREHQKGRRLFVGTTNLDAQRFVIWDMGAIALRGDSALFHKVLLASASIPVSFPPVFFSVTANGQQLDEMHADGGTIMQLFTTYRLLSHVDPSALPADATSHKIRSDWFIIRNGAVTPSYEAVKNDLFSIAMRSMDTIIDAQGLDDTYRAYVLMKSRGNGYNLAYIPVDYVPNAKEMFDTAEMRRLFDRGYDDAAKGNPWRQTPPGMDE